MCLTISVVLETIHETVTGSTERGHVLFGLGEGPGLLTHWITCDFSQAFWSINLSKNVFILINEEKAFEYVYPTNKEQIVPFF